jgi:iron complex outermembrane receptor protein
MDPRAAWATIALVTLLLPRGSPADAGVDPEPRESFMHLSLDELFDVPVTSVAGVEQSWFETPAAVDVLTADAIRRTGARTLPEALRWTPGVNVGQVDARQAAVSARGNTSLFGSRLLVLQDERTLYDPLFSGVFWDIHQPLAADLDRIEIVRGPGPTLWGANAINGVINITTKHARDTQGLHVDAGGGTEERAFGAVRWGSRLGERAWQRVFLKYDARDASQRPDGSDGPDDWDLLQGGFRVDVEPDDRTSLRLVGEAYRSDDLGETVRVPVPGHFTFDRFEGDGEVFGGSLLARAERRTSDRARWSLRYFFDRRARHAFAETDLHWTRHDLDYRHVLSTKRHELTWGAGITHTADDLSSNDFIAFAPGRRTYVLHAAFVQDSVEIRPGRMRLILGTKVHHDDFTGWELQPSVRFAWMPGPGTTLWGAVTRAVRTPSRLNEDLTLTVAWADTGLIGGGPPSGVFVPLQIQGNPDLDAETALVYEMGYRAKLSEELGLWAAAFHSDAHDIIRAEPGRPFFNEGDGETNGLELRLTWRPASRWQLVGSAAFLDIHDSFDPDVEGNSPRHRVTLLSFLDVNPRLEVNATFQYTDVLPTPDVDHLERLDLGLTWRPGDHVELAVWWQDVLRDDPEVEFVDTFLRSEPARIERGAYAQVTLRF